MKVKECEHITSARKADFESKDVCEECVKTGSEWVHLRLCLSCGKTLCCDSSPNQHMTKHATAHGHNVVRSAEHGESWYYCYPDKLFVTQ